MKFFQTCSLAINLNKTYAEVFLHKARNKSLIVNVSSGEHLNSFYRVMKGNCTEAGASIITKKNFQEQTNLSLHQYPCILFTNKHINNKIYYIFRLNSDYDHNISIHAYLYIVDTLILYTTVLSLNK